MAQTFAQLGFSAVVTASSLEPATDGYVGTLNGLPYHIHPSSTPAQWAALGVAIAANLVMVNPYVAPVPTSAQLADQLATQAQLALDKSDITMIRCWEHNISVPEAWQSYRASLRAVIAGTLSTLPTQPAFPAGS